MRRPGPRRPRSRGSAVFRLQAGFLVIAIVLSIFAGRLVQLQGLDPHAYAAMAAAEGTVTVSLPATRGEILDRRGSALADSVAGKMVVADPQQTAPQAPALAKILARRLGVDYAETLDRLRTGGDSRFQYIARQVPDSIATAVVEDATAAGFRGLDTRDDPIRTYPAKDVAANLLGFLGTPKKSGRARPLAGLEVAFNKMLAGKDGQTRYQVGSGNRLPLGETTVEEAVDGKDLHTTIDGDLQWYVQRVLRDTVRNAAGESGYAVVMDSQSGEVLALADYPTYDASRPYRSDESTYKAASVSDVYEPGSVQKVLTAAALIDAGKVTMRTKFTVPGELERQDRVINDWFPHGIEKFTLAGIIAKSSNIGTVLAADEFEPGQLRRYLKKFGLGSRPGSGLLGEVRGLLPAASAWTSQSEDRIGFGQSVSVSALQMTAAINTIANDGVRIDPSVILGTATNNSGVAIGTDTSTSTRVVSSEAARQTSLMMERVLDPDEGVAPSAAVPGYRVAGKTGTAQRVDPECGCYEGTTVSFGGFAPADDPRFTVYVAVQGPREGSGGGSTAGPAFARIMGHVLGRYGVPPTGTAPSRVPTTW